MQTMATRNQPTGMEKMHEKEAKEKVQREKQKEKDKKNRVKEKEKKVRDAEKAAAKEVRVGVEVNPILVESDTGSDKNRIQKKIWGGIWIPICAYVGDM